MPLSIRAATESRRAAYSAWVICARPRAGIVATPKAITDKRRAFGMRNVSAADNFRIVMPRAIWLLVLAAVPTAFCAAQGPPDAPSVVAADGYGGVVAALE